MTEETSNIKSLTGSLDGSNLKLGIVVARFNEIITKSLLEGAISTSLRYGVKASNISVVWVPGSFELPIVSKTMAKSGKFDAIIAIGCVIRGATAHFEYVAGGAQSGIMNASLDSGIPVIFGVITVENMDQALARSGGHVGNKGSEAALTAIETANLLKTIKSKL